MMPCMLKQVVYWLIAIAVVLQIIGFIIGSPFMPDIPF